MKCMPCLRGLCQACKGGDNSENKAKCSCTHEIKTGLPEEERENRTSSRYKRDDALKDQQSTGRKRAARLYPIICADCEKSVGSCECDKPALPACEWKGQATCGGGKSPVLGCTSGTATDRHHGPDKAVTNNEQGNVHRICTWCHHAWHASNNEEYDWNVTVFAPHNPRPWTMEEELEARIKDANRKSRPKPTKIAD